MRCIITKCALNISTRTASGSSFQVPLNTLRSRAWYSAMVVRPGAAGGGELQVEQLEALCCQCGSALRLAGHWQPEATGIQVPSRHPESHTTASAQCQCILVLVRSSSTLLAKQTQAHLVLVQLEAHLARNTAQLEGAPSPGAGGSHSKNLNASATGSEHSLAGCQCHCQWQPQAEWHWQCIMIVLLSVRRLAQN